MRTLVPSLLTSLFLVACGGSAASSRTADATDATARDASEAPATSTPDAPEAAVTGPSRPLPTDGAEGVQGTVSVLTGDHMPPVRGGIGPAPERPIHVLRGRHPQSASLDRSVPHYVGSTTTGPDGTYRAALPPGEYTVITEHDGLPYLNSTYGDGTWFTITVEAGQWATFDIQDTADATF